MGCFACGKKSYPFCGLCVDSFVEWGLYGATTRAATLLAADWFVPWVGRLSLTAMFDLVMSAALTGWKSGWCIEEGTVCKAVNFLKKMGWHGLRCGLDTRHRWDGAQTRLSVGALRFWEFEIGRLTVWVDWVFDGFCIVCSLIILYRRKRNVGGIVCGTFQATGCSNRTLADTFLDRTMLPGFDFGFRPLD